MKLFFQFLLFLFLTNSFAQKPAKLVGANCRRTSNDCFIQLASRFPFNQTAKIAILAYNSKRGPQGLEPAPSSTKEVLKEPQYGLPLSNDTLEFMQLREWKFLNLQEIAELADILYNYNFNPNKNPIVYGSFCFVPRNGIAFLNEQNKIIDFIDICFECSQLETMHENHSFGDFCDGKIELLFSFFRKKGIIFGVQKNLNYE